MTPMPLPVTISFAAFLASATVAMLAVAYRMWKGID
jgi:hypothetical protein